MARRLRRFVKNHGSSMKVTGIQAAGGAAVAVIDRQILSSESGQKMLGESTYIKPLLILAGAYVIRTKAPNLSAGMAGGAGFMAAQAYFANADEEGGETKGIVDTGALRNYPPAFGYPRQNMYADAGAVFEVVPG